MAAYIDVSMSDEDLVQCLKWALRRFIDAGGKEDRLHRDSIYSHFTGVLGEFASARGLEVPYEFTTKEFRAGKPDLVYRGTPVEIRFLAKRKVRVKPYDVRTYPNRPVIGISPCLDLDDINPSSTVRERFLRLLSKYSVWQTGRDAKTSPESMTTKLLDMGNVFRLIGWVYAEEAPKLGTQDYPDDDEPCYFVPVSKARPMTSIGEVVN